MAWCPFAIHRPLSENHLQGAIVPRAVILHTAVSASNSLFDFFERNSDLESHFYVTEEGMCEQYMDTQIRADANKNANSFAVSIETEDSRLIKPFTPAQLSTMIRLVSWICDTHKIPKVQIPRADGAGIGWHVMFGAPGPWTPVAKSCPGQPRIDQTRDIIIPAVARGSVLQEDDMQLSDMVELFDKSKASVNNVLAGTLSRLSDKVIQSKVYPHVKDSLFGFIAAIDQNVISQGRQIEALQREMDELRTKSIEGFSTVIAKIDEITPPEE